MPLLQSACCWFCGPAGGDTALHVQGPLPEDDLAGTWERLLLDASGEPLLERRDVWGFPEDDANAPRNRGLRYG